jgi:5-methylcytosine-specific restriction endonuclease McrA
MRPGKNESGVGMLRRAARHAASKIVVIQHCVSAPDIRPRGGVAVKSFLPVHKSDAALSHDTPESLFRQDTQTAEALAHIAEFDARKLYRPAGYDSMHEYLVQVCNRSQDAAYDLVQAARCAREFPAMFEMVADSRLHLAGVLLLAPHLTYANAAELLEASDKKSKRQIAAVLAARFPRSEVLPLVTAIPDQKFGPVRIVKTANALSFGPGRTDNEPRPKVEPIAQRRYVLQLSIGEETHALLQSVQDLLSHQVPGGDLAQVLHRALGIADAELKKAKYAATDKPRRARGSSNARCIPACVRRAVYERDGGQCTYVSESGHRCASRKRLEFDHMLEVARGGESTMENVRLRCRAHNQYTAEKTFGAEFMEQKRQAAKKAAHDDVIPWLRALGIRADDARRAAERTDMMLEAPLEERVKRALTFCGPRGVVQVPAPA